MGRMSYSNLLLFSLFRYNAGAVTAKIVDWLVDCGMPVILAKSKEMLTESKIMLTSE